MLRTPTGPIGALLESLDTPPLPFRDPLGLEIWESGRALGAPVRVSGPLLGYRGPYHIFFPGPTAALSGPDLDHHVYFNTFIHSLLVTGTALVQSCVHVRNVNYVKF